MNRDIENYFDICKKKLYHTSFHYNTKKLTVILKNDSIIIPFNHENDSFNNCFSAILNYFWSSSFYYFFEFFLMLL